MKLKNILISVSAVCLFAVLGLSQAKEPDDQKVFLHGVLENHSSIPVLKRTEYSPPESSTVGRAGTIVWLPIQPRLTDSIINSFSIQTKLGIGYAVHTSFTYTDPNDANNYCRVVVDQAPDASINISADGPGSLDCKVLARSVDNVGGTFILDVHDKPNK